MRNSSWETQRIVASLTSRNSPIFLPALNPYVCFLLINLAFTALRAHDDSFLQVMTVERPFTVILDDPLSNSYLQNIYAPDEDPNMTVEMYDRTFEQNEDLGLNDMRVENYN